MKLLKIYVDDRVYRKLREICRKKNITMSDLLMKAIECALRELDITK